MGSDCSLCFMVFPSPCSQTPEIDVGERGEANISILWLSDDINQCSPGLFLLPGCRFRLALLLPYEDCHALGGYPILKGYKGSWLHHRDSTGTNMRVTSDGSSLLIDAKRSEPLQDKYTEVTLFLQADASRWKTLSLLYRICLRRDLHFELSYIIFKAFFKSDSYDVSVVIWNTQLPDLCNSRCCLVCLMELI